MIPNLVFDVTAHYDNDDIDINRLDRDYIRLLGEVLLHIFHKDIYKRRREE